MQITKIKVNGFKSLVDFEMDISKFTCLIGLNGSGKSTLLQFIDFLSHLVRGDMEPWLEERHWESYELGSDLLPRKQTIDFAVTLMDETNNAVIWEARYNLYDKKCTHEVIETRSAIFETENENALLLKTESQNLTIWKNKRPGVPYEKSHEGKLAIGYRGSVLSAIVDEKLLPDTLKEFRSFFKNVISFDMLAPQSLRKRDRKSDGSIGMSGQRLSAFLHELGSKRQEELAQKLKIAYPHLEDVFTRSLQSGWKRLSIKELYAGREIFTEAKHVNDGMLRLIAILAELESQHEFLLFDEIENGINPELVQFVIDILTNARQQIMVTTHSPMILNYLDDDTARESVMYMYKSEEGKTKAIRFFDIPSLREKLTVMGPGEAFVDTNLVELADEINSVLEAK